MSEGGQGPSFSDRRFEVLPVGERVARVEERLESVERNVVEMRSEVRTEIRSLKEEIQRQDRERVAHQVYGNIGWNLFGSIRMIVVAVIASLTTWWLGGHH